MDKRYQIFVSSTYTDLRDERAKVIQALMEMDCIPAGMELFPAVDETQWQFIKKVIDDCDYYVLIMGGRYGSLATDGISYTEKEYDYAVDRGLKIIALIHGAPDSLPVSKSDVSPDKLERLSAFRHKVIKGRMVRFWEDATELPGLVATSLSRTIRTYPAVGWVRAHTVAIEGLFEELNVKENSVRAFREGGSAKRLEGVWSATWSVLDKTGSPQPYLVSDPNNATAKIAYPAERIVLKSEGSIVFCTSGDSFNTGQNYWLGGRMSLKNELCLVYWNDSNPMAGTVFLTLTEKYPFPLKLTGWWCGHNREDEVILGQVEWVKLKEIV